MTSRHYSTGEFYPNGQAKVTLRTYRRVRESFTREEETRYVEIMRTRWRDTYESESNWRNVHLEAVEMVVLERPGGDGRAA